MGTWDNGPVFITPVFLTSVFLTSTFMTSVPTAPLLLGPSPRAEAAHGRTQGAAR